MFDKDLVKEILTQILDAAKKILKRFESIHKPDDFLISEQGQEKLDAICMQLIAIGESLKNVDKITDRRLFEKYPGFEWQKAKQMRDIISHHYFDVNSDIIFDVCKNEIPKLKNLIEKILKNDFEGL